MSADEQTLTLHGKLLHRIAELEAENRALYAAIAELGAPMREDEDVARSRPVFRVIAGGLADR